jgi:hypothetical protein
VHLGQNGSLWRNQEGDLIAEVDLLHTKREGVQKSVNVED